MTEELPGVEALRHPGYTIDVTLPLYVSADTASSSRKSRACNPRSANRTAIGMGWLPAAQPTTRGLPTSIGRPRRLTVQMPAASTFLSQSTSSPYTKAIASP